ncbi:MAG: flavin-containing monooxygenase, partial [Dietzia cercidiphylli]
MTSSASPANSTRRRPRVLIIGAGFGGLGAAYELIRDDLADVTILEKADDVGGVWRDNTYPGAACDVPSNLYSYSFHRKTDWGRRYAEQPDILSYIRETADRYGLRDRVRTGIEVTSATFDEDTATWTVLTASGESFEADVLVPAIGQLSRPAYPNIPGLDSFAGPSFHSARWRHDVDLTGKRVAVLGTGASAIQFVPRIREAASHVTVYQRSAPWVVPKPDRAYTDAHHTAFARVPGLVPAMRGAIWETTEAIGLALTSARPLARILSGLAKANLRLTVRDPELRAALTPTEPIGCKRMLFSNEWYRALAQPVTTRSPGSGTASARVETWAGDACGTTARPSAIPRTRPCRRRHAPGCQCQATTAPPSKVATSVIPSRDPDKRRAERAIAAHTRHRLG